MFGLFLQIWGALFYLLNKVFFSLAERSHQPEFKRKWLILAWSVYLVALPAWVIVFIAKDNWIAASIEFGSAPAMLVGLYVAVRAKGEAPTWLKHFAKVMLVIGLATSIDKFGGITTINQLVELAIVAGFLMGTYQLAQNKPAGYLWLILGNISCAALMLREDFFILMAQQIVSLGFVTDAYLSRRRQ